MHAKRLLNHFAICPAILFVKLFNEQTLQVLLVSLYM